MRCETSVNGNAVGKIARLWNPRNMRRWTSEEHAGSGVLLRRLSNLSPYLIVLALPGSVLMLPVLGWWLNRRRNQRPPDSSEHCKR